MGALTHPLQRRPRRHRRLAFACLAALALLPLVLGTVLHPLHEDRPGGEDIVAFELAGSVERAQEIVTTWEAEGVIEEAKAIQLSDFLYPLIYAGALAGACIAASGAWRRLGRERIAAAGIAMAWVAVAAAAFDYVENLGLDISLWGEPASPWPEVARIAALLKFGAIGLSLAYGLTGLAAASIGWARSA
ncbi:MAG TPA: hypothetical protein VFS64_02695 [Solirubrobacterales bacterium]|nr:hypothetical protein [Solirubrobacterales bacterium]